MEVDFKFVPPQIPELPKSIEIEVKNEEEEAYANVFAIFEDLWDLKYSFTLRDIPQPGREVASRQHQKLQTWLPSRHPEAGSSPCLLWSISGS